MLFLVSPASCAIISISWNIGLVKVSPAGVERLAIGVNSVWPPPAIHAFVGDIIQLSVLNSLTDPTSLHAHGIYQNNTNFMDGAAGVTNCAIKPGSSFLYEYNVSQKGTFWIHGHVNGQYVDGLRAPLIFHSQNESLQLRYDKEYIVSLSDWYNDDHAKLLKQFLSIKNPSGAEPIPNAALINEKQNDIFEFAAGKTYRLRFICMTALSMFSVWIDDHKMTVVEVDGIDVEPYEVDALPISSAQRYSVLVRAKNITKFNYKLNAKFNMAMFDNAPADLNPLVTATIQYAKNSTLFDIGGVEPTHQGFNDMVFKPLLKEDSVEPDSFYEMNMYFGLFDDGINHGTFNDVVYEHAKVPAIFTAMTLGEYAVDKKVYGQNTNSFILKHLDMVEIVINNLDIGDHPIVIYF
jgi:iron transport multicopper oxidase